MLFSYSTRNTNTVMHYVYGRLFPEYGYQTNSRNGKVYAIADPVMLEYQIPIERVNFCPIREANPFFHLLEAIWMCAGSNKVEWIANILPRMKEFSDDGITLNGAYGFRLALGERENQLQEVVNELRRNKDSRRAVASMWHPYDLFKESKDKPCNTHLYFRVINRSVTMTVCNRSNDAIWGGVSGANMVHLSVFHEYVAKSLDFSMGPMYVLSNNLHAYSWNNRFEELVSFYKKAPMHMDLYSLGIVNSTPIITDALTFLDECRDFVEDKVMDPKNVFLYHTAAPMELAYEKYKVGKVLEAMSIVRNHVQSSDWKQAAIAWLSRRRK